MLIFFPNPLTTTTIKDLGTAWSEALVEEIYPKSYTEDKLAKFNKHLFKHLQPDSKFQHFYTPQTKKPRAEKHLQNFLIADEESVRKERPMKQLNSAAVHIARQKERRRLEQLTRRERAEEYLTKHTSPARKPSIRTHPIYFEKSTPNRQKVETTKKPTTGRFYSKICLPSKDIKQVAFKQCSDEVTTLDKDNIDKILVVPKPLPEKPAPRLKTMKILHMIIRRPTIPPSEKFLPKVSKIRLQRHKKDTETKLNKAEVMEFRFELLRQLHKEFTSLQESRRSTPSGSFERVSKYYDKTVEDAKRDEGKRKIVAKGLDKATIHLQKEICHVNINLHSDSLKFPKNSTELLIKRLGREEFREKYLEKKIDDLLKHRGKPTDDNEQQ